MHRVKVKNQDLIKIIEDNINNKNFELLVKGKSMRPFYKDLKTTVTLSKVKKLAKYDVILFKINNKYFLHRIIKIKGDNIKAQGDGLISSERLVKSDVIASVIKHQTNNKITYSKSRLYGFKVRVWRILRPIRRILLKVMRH